MTEPLLDDGGDPWPEAPVGQTGRGLAHYATLLGLGVATASIVATGVFLDPDPRGFGTHEQLGFGPCGMLESTGVPCPACGITTAVTLSAQGSLWRGFLTQPVGPVLVVATPLFFLLAVRFHWRGEDVYQRYRQRRWPWVRVGLALALGAWAYRILN